MRITLFLLFVAPLFLHAQINRSAKELACEKVHEYIVTRLFKNMPYKSVSYGELKPYDQVRSETAWTIEHNFEITETKLVQDQEGFFRQALSLLFLP